ncbi:hypothetical protein CXB51_022035 [Gossypium anomalum]|uniref:Protein FAR1-RELATED SEQUENCE n=1 Tax=Gossypium anomalum TaxID=47600 RepID=A0A8J5YJN4_9ROSI|nr:hypothetical protein CXB51_022035 [Gossypium anomalum]
MFGCAFLLDGTATSFAWLFKSFLQSMDSQSLKIIMTDQDHAITKPIGEIFPDSCHGLCLWHISRNAPSHLGNLNGKANFHALFYKCRQVYTHEIYKCFKKEFLDGDPLIWREVAQNCTTYTFEAMMDEKSSRVRTVHFNTTTMEIHCTCKKFAFCGCLCFHALRIPSVKNVKKIFISISLEDGLKILKKGMYGGNVAEFS